ncbi:MAG: cyclic nucleotide-binding domain-containing protein [Desulfobulbus sp.]|jgi:CRP/FNR family cyclic AMP-dependent transcriptional regulator
MLPFPPKNTNKSSPNENPSFRDSIFIVLEEEDCPLYNVDEEFNIAGGILTLPEGKETCLTLTRELINLATGEQKMEHLSPIGAPKAKFECGGCDSGVLRFAHKKDKTFSTLQMKMLADAEQRAQLRELDKFHPVLRQMELFEPLSDSNLYELSRQLEVKHYPANKVILNQGDPGTRLYIILSGRVAVVGANHKVLAEMGPGDIFGEMSLLSGESVATSIYSRDRSVLATLSSKNFKHILARFPVLQVYLYRLLVERSQANSLRAGTISSGMSGRLEEVNPVELFQMLNSGQKSGTISLSFDDGKAQVIFHEGEVVRAGYRNLVDKDALFAILGRGKGEFTYTTGINEEDQARPPLGGFMALVMEGMRLMDERAA